MTAPGAGTPAATAPGRAAFEAASEELRREVRRLLTAGLGHRERGIDPRTVDAILAAADRYAQLRDERPRPIPELGAVAYEAAETGALRDELAKAEETIADYRGALCAMQDERDSLTGRVAELVTEVNALHAENAGLRDLVRRLERGTAPKWREQDSGGGGRDET